MIGENNIKKECPSCYNDMVLEWNKMGTGSYWFCPHCGNTYAANV